MKNMNDQSMKLMKAGVYWTRASVVPSGRTGFGAVFFPDRNRLLPDTVGFLPHNGRFLPDNHLLLPDKWRGQPAITAYYRLLPDKFFCGQAGGGSQKGWDSAGPLYGGAPSGGGYLFAKASRFRRAKVRALTVISTKIKGLVTKSLPPEAADFSREASSVRLVTNTTGVVRLGMVS
jgi:hypothetical protein